MSATPKWNAARACDVLGINRAPWELRAMHRALGFFSWRNTPEENERRAACAWVFRNGRAYSEECTRRRNAHNRVTYVRV